MERRNAQASLTIISVSHSRSNSAKSISRRMLPIDHDMQRPSISVSRVRPVWVLCHEYRRSKRRCATVLEMKEGPSGSAIRSPIPSHRERLWSKAMVVSVAETSGR